MPEDATTKPTVETILERINALEGRLLSEINALREEVGISLDRIEGMTNQTRAEMLTLRADFKEFRLHLKEPV
ncbi:MAG: hypothetical protein ACRD68_03760 [Pyrinomonadaceae bacterium]